MPIASQSTQFRLFWEAADAALIAEGMQLLSFEWAREFFELEIAPADVPAVITARSLKSPEAA